MLKICFAKAHFTDKSKKKRSNTDNCHAFLRLRCNKKWFHVLECGFSFWMSIIILLCEFRDYVFGPIVLIFGSLYVHILTILNDVLLVREARGVQMDLEMQVECFAAWDKRTLF